MNEETALACQNLTSNIDKFDKLLLSISDYIKISKAKSVKEAKRNVERLIFFLSKNEVSSVDNLHSREDIFIYQVSLSLIHELTDIISMEKLLFDKSRTEFFKKLNLILAMPLLPGEEDGVSNLGRNTLFEMRLLHHFLNSGYLCEIPETAHPDFRVITPKRNYSFECKRIFLAHTFKENIEKAIDQLVKYSLSESPDTGVVAINISRYFDINRSNLMFQSANDFEARRKIKLDYLKFRDETISSFKKIDFPLRVPLIVFEYREYGLINNELRSVTFTDLSDSQSHRRGFSLYETLLPDFIPLVKHYGLL